MIDDRLRLEVVLDNLCVVPETVEAQFGVVDVHEYSNWQEYHRGRDLKLANGITTSYRDSV